MDLFFKPLIRLVFALRVNFVARINDRMTYLDACIGYPLMMLLKAYRNNVSSRTDYFAMEIHI